MACPMTYCKQASITYDDITAECEQNYWKSQSRRGEMYGMLLESIQHYVQELYGKEIWQKVLEHAGLKNMIFTTHRVYKDEIMVNLAQSCSVILGDRNFDECMYFFGQCFVDFCRHYGYDKVLRVAGRHYRDFLNGIDNLHETIRFSYPKLQSPSFIVDIEDSNGCVLTYRSKRVGFAYYVTGQLTQCAKRLYNVDVSIRILQEIHTNNGCHVKYRLDFQNFGFNPPVSTPSNSGSLDYPRIASSTFFKLFPFCILFDRDMVIRYAGPNLTSIFRGQALIGCKLFQKFGLRRPLVDFTWENIMCLQKVIFEVESYQPLVLQCKKADCRCADNPSYHTSEDSSSDRLLLRGQMKYVDDWACLAFLCTPLIGNLEDMLQNGLYINDLNMFDNSQDMVLAGWHHASQLEYLVDQQIETSKKIADNLQKLDEWRQKSNTLLYSMMPESIAVRLKNGEDAIKTCETFEQVTIMFSYLIGFSEICAHATAFQVVECINSVFTVFDAIVDRYKVFKVETLGDAVYMVAGGVPDRRADHSQRVAGLALEFVDNAKFLKDPLSGNSLKVRIGMHVGGVVAGIVGKRTPQYCLFGDTVNTASRMQSYSQPGRIHISQTCHENLQGSKFATIYRGRVNVKGKGEQKTYWLAGRRGEPSTIRMINLIRAEQMRHKNTSNGSIESSFDLHGLHMSTSGTNFATNFSVLSDSEEDLDSVFNDELITKASRPKSPLNLSTIRFIDDDEEEEPRVNGSGSSQPQISESLHSPPLQLTPSVLHSDMFQTPKKAMFSPPSPQKGNSGQSHRTMNNLMCPFARGLALNLLEQKSNKAVLPVVETADETSTSSLDTDLSQLKPNGIPKVSVTVTDFEQTEQTSNEKTSQSCESTGNQNCVSNKTDHSESLSTACYPCQTEETPVMPNSSNQTDISEDTENSSDSTSPLCAPNSKDSNRMLNSKPFSGQLTSNHQSSISKGDFPDNNRNIIYSNDDGICLHVPEKTAPCACETLGACSCHSPPATLESDIHRTEIT